VFVQISCGRSSRVTPDYTRLQDAFSSANRLSARATYIATLVEHHTRYVMLAKVAGKDTQTVVSALIKQAKKLPKELYKSLTWDRGKELTDHRRFTLATNRPKAEMLTASKLLPLSP
jgi:hypothetical protein